MGPSDTPPYEPDKDEIYNGEDDFIEVISLEDLDSDHMESDEERPTDMAPIVEDEEDLEKDDDDNQEDAPGANSFITFKKHTNSKRCMTICLFPFVNDIFLSFEMIFQIPYLIAM
jgi:hypothetical protein